MYFIEPVLLCVFMLFVLKCVLGYGYFLFLVVLSLSRKRNELSFRMKKENLFCGSGKSSVNGIENTGHDVRRSLGLSPGE
jgi:hypothetical protein